MADFPVSDLTLEGTSQKTVKQYVLDDYRAAEIFERYGLDFCCGGNMSVADACARRSIDPLTVQAELDALDLSGRRGGGANDRFQDWSVDFLIDYIVNNHHHYIRRAIPTILQHAEKVVGAHGSRHPEMVRVAELFAELAGELSAHMQKEEGILFPRIKHLSHLSVNNYEDIPRGLLAAPILQMISEHDLAGDLAARIRTLTSSYVAPEDACTTFRTLLRELDEFERDLHQHVFLENNILFPKAVELEEKLSRPVYEAI